jgi:hypothetical protein
MAALVYSVDSSALIHAWRRIYRPKNFGFVWEGFDKLIVEGRFKASMQGLVAQIMRDHPKLVDTTKGRSGADPFVIALAATVDPKMTVITEETPGKERIPDVCLAQKIDYCGFADLIEKENWTS